MSLQEQTVLSGYAFVKEVIGRNRFRAGDYLASADGGECQWLEFKAVAGIGPDDAEVLHACRESGKSVTDACASVTRQNLLRIGKAIISLYNTRGGSVLIGVCEEDGLAKPTVRSEGGMTKTPESRWIRLVRYPFDLFRGILLIIRDLKALSIMNSLFELSRPHGCGDSSMQLRLDSLFERTFVFFRGIPIIALVVKCAVDENEVVLYSEDSGRSCHLAFRNGANNEVYDWPLVANRESCYAETRAEAESNDDLFQKAISLSFLSRPNRVLQMLSRVVRLFDRSFVASVASYVVTPVSHDKQCSRLRISFLYYGAYFVLLNMLLAWSLGPSLLLLIAMLIGLVVAAWEMKMRLRDMGLSVWALLPSVMFVLLCSVSPLTPWLLYVSSIGLVLSLGIVSLGLRSSMLDTRNDSVLSQIATSFVYLSISIVQYPLVLFAIADPAKSEVRNYILSFVVNLVPVIPSIVASRIAIVYREGFCVGCFLLFYMPYIMLFFSALNSVESEIVIVPRRFRGVLAMFCSLTIFLAGLGLFYMPSITIKAVGEADGKKRWDREIIARATVNGIGNSTRTASGGNASIGVGNGVGTNGIEKVVQQVRLTRNDFFAQAVSSYYYCFSNDVCEILDRYDAARGELSNRRYRLALSRHYRGLKNVEYSFIGSPDGEDDYETDDFAVDDYDENDVSEDFLSDRRLDVDGRIVKLFLEYVAAVRLAKDSTGGGCGDVKNAFKDTTDEARRRLFNQFDAMKLRIDWGYIKWINRSRQ